MDRWIEDVLNTESTWLRQAKADSLKRDPVDALTDAKALVDFLNARLRAVQGSRGSRDAD